MTVSVDVSLLDLARVHPGETISDSIARSVRLARTADPLGYTRLWFAEHHNMPQIASSATALLIQHVAAQTSQLRLGAGGIMLPNHSPLVIAEQFGMLATLFPGRIDLGLGRAPGTDQDTLRALRRTGAEAERFPEDVRELHGFLHGAPLNPKIQAYPGKDTGVPLTILGSSLYGAQLAAHFGLPYAFASHFAPQALHQATTLYRESFNPAGELAAPAAQPHLIVAANVIVADDHDTAQAQLRAAQDAWLQSTLGKQRRFTAEELELVREHPQGQQVLGMLTHSYAGTKDEVTTQLNALAADTGADELILVNLAQDEAIQHRTLELLAPRG